MKQRIIFLCSILSVMLAATAVSADDGASWNPAERFTFSMGFGLGIFNPSDRMREYNRNRFESSGPDSYEEVAFVPVCSVFPFDWFVFSAGCPLSMSHSRYDKPAAGGDDYPVAFAASPYIEAGAAFWQNSGRQALIVCAGPEYTWMKYGGMSSRGIGLRFSVGYLFGAGDQWMKIGNVFEIINADKAKAVRSFSGGLFVEFTVD